MDLQAEKLELIRMITKVTDERLIQQIHKLLKLHTPQDDELEAFIDKGLKQSDEGEIYEHKYVMKEMRTKYGK